MNQQASFRKPLFRKVWESAATKSVLWLVAIAALMAPGYARAQPSGGFDGLGQSLISSVCAFITSPVVTVVVAIALIGTLVVATLNEDKGLVSKMLKTLIGGFALILLPGLLTAIGFNMSC